MYTTVLNMGMGAGPQLVRYTIGYADLTTGATAQNITLFTLENDSKILGITIKHSTAFAGAGPWTTCTVSVGTVADPTAFASAFDIFQAVADTTFQDSAQYKSTSAAATAVIARFTASHNVNTGTAGSVDIDVLYTQVTTP